MRFGFFMIVATLATLFTCILGCNNYEPESASVAQSVAKYSPPPHDIDDSVPPYTGKVVSDYFSTTSKENRSFDFEREHSQFVTRGRREQLDVQRFESQHGTFEYNDGSTDERIRHPWLSDDDIRHGVICTDYDGNELGRFEQPQFDMHLTCPLLISPKGKNMFWSKDWPLKRRYLKGFFMSDDDIYAVSWNHLLRYDSKSDQFKIDGDVSTHVAKDGTPRPFIDYGLKTGSGMIVFLLADEQGFEGILRYVDREWRLTRSQQIVGSTTVQYRKVYNVKEVEGKLLISLESLDGRDLAVLSFDP